MKTKFLNISFRTFSFLAEKTGGWRIFVQPKLWLGAMLLGVIGINSCSKAKVDEPMCYDPVPEVTCYIMPAPNTADADANSTNE